MASPAVRIGEILAGKYRVERVLGVGAMGVVIAATHVDLHELRAIKMMLPSMLGDTEGVERFLREARAVSKLRSRHVAAVYDVGRFDTGAPFIVMEHLEGSDLKSVLNQRGVLSPEDAAAYVSEACEALSEAHAAGIIHRDIKPANLFLATRAGYAPTIKLLDFGIAKMASAEGAPAAMEMTRTNEILGTPLYMSPEQMRSMRNADARSDVWSLGVILYRAVTGKVPFTGETMTEVCIAVLGDTPALPSALRPDLPPGFDAVILGCLEKDPARRIASAAALATALAPFVSASARAPLSSVATAPALPAVASAGDMTTAATLVWKPGVAAEGRDQTSSRASWSQTGTGAATRALRPKIPWVIGGVVAASALALVAGWRLFGGASAPAPAASAELAAPPPGDTGAAPRAPASTAPIVAAPSAPPPIVAPLEPSAKAVAAAPPPPPPPPKASLPAPRASASPKAPVAAPAAPTGDVFGGRY